MADQLQGCRIKGGIIKAHLEAVRQRDGDKGVADILRRLPPEMTAEIRSALSATWVSFEALIVLDRTIVAGSGGALSMRELGRSSARQNLSTTYRAFRRADIHEFFTRSAALHDQFQDFGREEYVRLGERAGRILQRNYRCFATEYCESAAGYYEEVMKMHGATNVSVEHPECLSRGGRECVFELRW